MAYMGGLGKLFGNRRIATGWATAFASLLLTPTDANAQCVDGNCTSGFGRYVYSNGAVYEGYFESGKRHLWGSYFWPNGDHYTGNWVHEQRTYFGMYTWADRTSYIGMFRRGNLAGSGIKVEHGRFAVQTQSGGFDASGCVLGNCTNGYGVYVWSSTGDVYSGFWEGGKIAHWGALFRGNGTYSIGLLLDGSFSGHSLSVTSATNHRLPPNAKLRWSRSGCISGDCTNGIGFYSYGSNQFYVGTWVDGEQQNFGGYYWGADHSGNYYLGGWDDGERTNCGIMAFYQDTAEPRTGCTMRPRWANESQRLNLAIEQTGGKIYSVSTAAQVPSEIRRILTSETKRFADVMILIDKTGSMNDDIAAVRTELDDILNSLPFKSWAGLSFFGDRNSDGAEWLSVGELTTNFSSLRTRLQNLRTGGGGSTMEESIYDATYETMERTRWEAYSDRRLIVIGDSAPLTGAATRHDLAAVSRLAKERGIKISFIRINN